MGGQSCPTGQSLRSLVCDVSRGEELSAVKSSAQRAGGAAEEQERSGDRGAVQQMSSFQREHEGAKSLFRRLEVLLLVVAVLDSQ